MGKKLVTTTERCNRCNLDSPEDRGYAEVMFKPGSPVCFVSTLRCNSPPAEVEMVVGMDAIQALRLARSLLRFAAAALKAKEDGS